MTKGSDRKEAGQSESVNCFNFAGKQQFVRKSGDNSLDLPRSWAGFLVGSAPGPAPGSGLVLACPTLWNFHL